jgi:ParB-like chromosome segregation protein Spo0J
MLFDAQPMSVLEASIQRVGILVPLTVYRETRSGNFVILDGQRRWICAQRVGLKEVPVNEVAEPTLVQNIVTMFQIHKLREDWELMPTALKVELLMNELNDRNEARLAELTGLDVAVISRCKKLISFDRGFQDMMLDPDPDKRIKADFFIELYPVLHDREISKFEWFKPKRFTRQMLNKYLNQPRTLKSVTDFRIIKQHAANARRAKRTKVFSRRLQTFAETQETELSHLEIAEASTRAEAQQITKKVDAVRATVDSMDVEQLYGEEGLWQALLELSKAIDRKLRQAGKKR